MKKLFFLCALMPFLLVANESTPTMIMTQTAAIGLLIPISTLIGFIGKRELMSSRNCSHPPPFFFRDHLRNRL